MVCFNGVNNTMSFPSLTIWTENIFTSNYELREEKLLSNITIANHSIFVAKFDPPLSVRAGYFIGLKYQGGAGEVTLQPSLLDLGQGNANESLYVTFDAMVILQSSTTRNDQYLPLVIPAVRGMLYLISIMLIGLHTRTDFISCSYLY